MTLTPVHVPDLSTRQVLVALRGANPGRKLTEHQLRYSIRADRALVPKPRESSFCAGVLAWRVSDIQAVALALRLRAPSTQDLLEAASAPRGSRGAA